MARKLTQPFVQSRQKLLIAYIVLKFFYALLGV